MRKKIFWCAVFTAIFTPITLAYSFIPPGDKWYTPDLNLKQSDKRQYDAEQGGKRILEVIDFVNGRLWYIIWFVCFAFVVINGFKMITAGGNSDGFKKATKGLMGAVVGIVICFLSYGVVNVLIKLFN